MSSIPPTSPPSVIRPPSPPPFPQEASSSLSSGISSSRVPLDMSSDSPLVPIDALASSDRPASRRARSSSNGTSASTSHATFEPSSVPSTPQNVPHRFWRPTPNVPFRVSQRHQLHRVTNHGDEEDHNQWLSEDEGLQGVGPSIGRRRRRKTSHRGGSGDDGDRQDRRNPGTNTVRERSRVEEGKEAGTEAAIEAIRRNPSASRPTIRRVQSLDPPPAPVAGPSSIPLTEQQGVSPPRIENLVPATISSALAIGLGLSNITQSVNPAPSVVSIEGIEERMSDSVPDFSSGRGGDGIGGFGLPAATVVDKHEDGLKRRERQDDLLGKLQRILGCALCPPGSDGPPPLHRPITLPCGHTISAEHISVPAPPPLLVASDLPHELFAAQQRQNQQRLNLWAGIMCPIPTCKRYSAQSGTATALDPLLETPSSPTSITSGAQRGEVLASGVTYYPSPNLRPPSYSHDPQATVVMSSPMVDICVDKTLQIVLQELAKEGGEDREKREAASSGSDSLDDQDSAEYSSHTSLSPHLAALGQPEMPPSPRRLPKRRRNQSSSQSRMPRPSLDSPELWPFQKELSGILECDVCAMLLHEPVTTPCQHSFCLKCLSRSLDHSYRCPVCRQDLPSFAFFQDHAINKVLLTIIKTTFPDEYAERQLAIGQDERDARLETPIFVCTLAFPGMPTILHVFEPRYRLMIRRCIESSSPRFGMLLPARNIGSTGIQGVMEYGTMLEIQSVQMLPDGRSMVETIGAHRFKLVEKGNLDGYTVGRVERIDDISADDEASLEQEAVARAAESRAVAAAMQPLPSVDVPPGGGVPLATPIPAEEAAQTTEEYMAICRAFIEQLRSGSAPWLLQRLNNTYGTMPTDPSEFSYWMALVMPIDEYEKARLLPIRSARLRLKLIVHWAESLRSSWW